MKIKIFLLVNILMFVLVSCSIQNEYINMTSTTNTIMSTTQSFQSTNEVVQFFATPTIVQTGVYGSDFDVIDIIPNDRLLKIDEVELGSNTRILVYDPVEEKIKSIYNKNIEDVDIKYHSPIGYEGITISPDFAWFAYDMINSNGFHIIVSSLANPKEQYIFDDLIGYKYTWIDNEHILVFDNDDIPRACPKKAQILNPFTREVRDLPDIFSVTPAVCFPRLLFNPDMDSSLFLTEQGWNIYNYEKETYTHVLPDLEKTIEMGYIDWNKDGISVAMHGDKFIKFALDIPEDQFDQQISISKITFPDNIVISNYGLDYWNPEKQLIGFDLKISEGNNIFTCNDSKTFAIFELSSNKLFNYCVNRYYYQNIKVEPTSILSSKDGNYFGWTIRDYEGDSGLIASVILNTKTGNISYLEGYQLLGFLEMKP